MDGETRAAHLGRRRHVSPHSLGQPWWAEVEHAGDLGGQAGEHLISVSRPVLVRQFDLDRPHWPTGLGNEHSVGDVPITLASAAEQHPLAYPATLPGYPFRTRLVPKPHDIDGMTMRQLRRRHPPLGIAQATAIRSVLNGAMSASSS